MWIWFQYRKDKWSFKWNLEPSKIQTHFLFKKFSSHVLNDALKLNGTECFGTINFKNQACKIVKIEIMSPMSFSLCKPVDIFQ